jgi:hypothetical protein
MSDYAQDLLALLKSDATVTKYAAARFHEDHVPHLNGTLTEPFVWFSQRQETPGSTLDGAQGEAPDTVVFDMECSGGSQRRTYQKALGAAVRALLHNYRSTFGSGTVKGIFIRDKDNDHIPVSNGGDAGVLVTAFDVEVWP